MAKQTSEAGSKSLAKIEANSYALATYAESELREVVEINLGGESSLSEFDLVRYKVPSGGGLAFNRESPDGDSSPSEIVGIILAQQTRRGYWKAGIDEGGGGTPPDCQSPDGINGFGSMAGICGGQCARCPMAQFGTAKGRDGRPSKGQACQQKKAVFIAEADSILPAYLSLPPTSLDPFKKFLAGLISKRLPMTGVVTRITLAKATNSNGVVYAEAKFEVVGVLDPETSRRMTMHGQTFGKMFRPSTVGGQPAATNPDVVAPSVNTSGRVVVASSPAGSAPSSSPLPPAEKIDSSKIPV